MLIENKLLLFIKQHENDSFGSFQIGVIEFVLDVPAERAELPPFLHQTVEETGSQNQFVENLALIATVQVLI